MPYVNIQITTGATRAQKSALVRDVTASLVRELGKKPEHIHVVIQEVAEENWGFTGLLTDDWRRAQTAGVSDGFEADPAGGAAASGDGAGDAGRRAHRKPGNQSRR